MYYFTVNYSAICYSTTTPAVCISETDLRRFTQDFTIVLFYYHDPSRLPILLFDSTTTPAVCISQTHLYRLYHKVCISETELCMLTPKFAC